MEFNINLGSELLKGNENSEVDRFGMTAERFSVVDRVLNMNGESLEGVIRIISTTEQFDEEDFEYQIIEQLNSSLEKLKDCSDEDVEELAETMVNLIEEYSR